MSRIGRAPIEIPANVTFECKDNVVTVKGPMGTLSQPVDSKITVKSENGKILVERHSEAKEHRALHGLYRALIANMVKGVTTGFEKHLLVNGVGYRCSVQGNKLVMNIGFSHPVEYEAPEGIKLEMAGPLEIVVKGIDKQKVGQIAATIRDFKKVEPYHGYGIQYKDEVVIRKVGKAAGK